MKKLITVLIGTLFVIVGHAQILFPEKCEGTWEGMMKMYNNGILSDSVKIQLSIAKTAEENTWTWRTEYFSKTHPMVKDYKLRVKDLNQNLYVVDEGEGLELNSYLVGNKFYSVFETSGYLLTSSYELVNGKIIFEVTSGEKLEGSVQEVFNYSVAHVQRAELSMVSE